MIHQIVEKTYRSFNLVYHDEKGNTGWKCFIGETEYLFPNQQAAESAINQVVEASKDIIKQHDGKKLQSVPIHGGTKWIEVDKPY